MKLLILLTNQSKLHLIDGELHPSGFWAEELVVPYKRFKQEGYEINIATIGGIRPTPDETSIDPNFLKYVRPEHSENHDLEASKEYIQVIENLTDLHHPMNINTLTEKQMASYDGVYISGGHGAIGDFTKSDALTQVIRWTLELEKPLAVVCHGHCALLALRDGESVWPFAGYRMTCFSHSEELVTNMAGKLPLVLEVEIKRLGAHYEKADTIWDSHVVEDRNLLTGQNPHSSKALAEAFVKKLNSANQ
ncbi:type 1 glutamine amidotransferase domain-containing protein [Dictyobacter arantiisoli]|uniref:Dimethylallyltransferase n=1 Tax=Dictyobacter arantiisoli TaxID=2014874 RepID=A0A5A5T906_9CHLR|nr:type 1 glutamine amidotransferase domain-containing protein [Dictyobacter arantiisoli]GCF07970.1 dimethylallyltransferase [Dictyobacter arantiisoli]